LVPSQDAWIGCGVVGRLVMYVERDSRKQVLRKVENAGQLEYLSRCLELLISTMVDAVPRLSSMSHSVSSWYQFFYCSWVHHLVQCTGRGRNK